MYHSPVTKLLLSGLIIAGLLSSCIKNNLSSKPASPLQSIYANISGSSGYSILSAAIVKAGYDDSLNHGKGPYTLFAPSNAAFAFYGVGSAADLNRISTDSVKKIIGYHLITKYLPTDILPDGPDSAKTTLSGFPVYFTAGTQYIFINGNIISPPSNYACTNGIIHLINGILNPPTAAIAPSLSNIKKLSLFNAAVIRANLTTTLSGTTLYTVFAPSDSAFAAAGYASIQAINSTDPAVLAKLVSYHIISGRLFSTDLVNAATPQTLQGGKITLSTGTAITVLGASNKTAGTATSLNITASNGVIYIINQLLTP